MLWNMPTQMNFPSSLDFTKMIRNIYVRSRCSIKGDVKKTFFFPQQSIHTETETRYVPMQTVYLVKYTHRFSSNEKSSLIGSYKQSKRAQLLFRQRKSENEIILNAIEHETRIV